MTLPTMSSWFVQCGVSCAIVTIACSAPTPRNTNDDHEAAGQDHIYGGHLIAGGEARAFRPCGSNKVVWTTGAVNALQSSSSDLALAASPSSELFAIIRGTPGPALAEGVGASYSGHISVDDVLYVTREGFGCDLDLESFWARGSGNEPFWSIVISADGIEFTSLGGERIVWDSVGVVTRDREVEFQSSLPTPLHLIIRADPCTDSMSGAFHGHSVVMELSGTTYSGCAIRGAGQPPG